MVTRDYAVSNTSSSESNSEDGYTWTIVFPPGSPDAPQLGVDGAALEGQRAAGNLVEMQIARTPEIQRVSTSAGSAILGGFTLEFNGKVTEGLVYNATVDEVSQQRPAEPSVDEITFMTLPAWYVLLPSPSTYRGRKLVRYDSAALLGTVKVKG